MPFLTETIYRYFMYALMRKTKTKIFFQLVFWNKSCTAPCSRSSCYKLVMILFIYSWIQIPTVSFLVIWYAKNTCKKSIRTAAALQVSVKIFTYLLVHASHIAHNREKKRMYLAIGEEVLAYGKRRYHLSRLWGKLVYCLVCL